MINTAHLPAKAHTLTIGLFLLAWLLSACAPQTLKPIAAQPTPSTWLLQAEKLKTLQTWSIKGKLGLRTTDRIDSAVINRWNQDRDHYLLDLSSSLFGIGATRLEGDSKHLIIQRSGEKPIFSSQPESLMQQETGWPLPLQQIPYWIKGLDAPGSKTDRNFTRKALPRTLNQDDWHIEYSRYKKINNYYLPGKVKFTRNQFRITLIIHEWSLPNTPTSNALTLKPTTSVMQQ